MAVEQITLRTALASEITTQKGLAAYINNSFTVEETWLPREKLEDLVSDHPNGKLYLVCQAPDEGPSRSRGSSRLCQREMGIMLGYQRAIVEAHNVSEMDEYVQLVDQLYETCRTLSEYQWIRNEAMKTENDVPYHYTTLQTHNVFEAYFTAYYLATIY